MSARADTRQKTLRRLAAIAAALVLLALILLAGGHWLLGIIFGVAAAGAIWAFLQARTVR